MARKGSITTALSNGDALTPIIIGTAAWAVAVLVLVLCRDSLKAAGTTWWFGACAVGIVSGLGGITYVLYRRRREGGAAR